MDKKDFFFEEIVIQRTKTPLMIKITLAFVMGMSFLSPIGITFLNFLQGKDFHFRIIISYFLFWGIGIYLLRVVLWNAYGQEILILEKDKIKYLADFKYFKDGQQEMSTAGLTTTLIFDNANDKNTGRIKLSNPNYTIETTLFASMKELEIISEKLNKYYNLTTTHQDLL